MATQQEYTASIDNSGLRELAKRKRQQDYIDEMFEIRKALEYSVVNKEDKLELRATLRELRLYSNSFMQSDRGARLLKKDFPQMIKAGLVEEVQGDDTVQPRFSHLAEFWQVGVNAMRTVDGLRLSLKEFDDFDMMVRSYAMRPSMEELREGLDRMYPRMQSFPSAGVNGHTVYKESIRRSGYTADGATR